MREGPSLAERCQNRWDDILRGVGLPERIFNRKSQPCPMCGGVDRFTYDNKGGNGSFICRKCPAAGDGVELVKRFKGIEFKEAATLIESFIGSAHVRAPQAAPDGQKQKTAMADLWRRGRRLTGEDIASRYLRGRNIELTEYPSAIRVVNSLPYFFEDKITGYFQGMIANFRSPDNTSGIIHRTYLEEPGKKAAVPKAKMFMPGRVPPGGAVRLAPAAETMGVAEGIETALAAASLHGIPVWATLSAGALTKWEPPAGAKHIIIFADVDATFTGQVSAYQLATRLIRCEWANKEKTERLSVEVRSPLFSDDGRYSEDWADVLRSEGAARTNLRFEELVAD